MPTRCAPNAPASEIAYSGAKSCWFRLERLTTKSLITARPPASSSLLTIGAELLKIGPQVVDILIVLQAGKSDSGARHCLHGRVNVRHKRLLAPDDAR